MEGKIFGAGYACFMIVTAVDQKFPLLFPLCCFFPSEMVVVQVHGSEVAPSESLFTCCWLEI
jgi:hypothetical protein